MTTQPTAPKASTAPETPTDPTVVVLDPASFTTQLDFRGAGVDFDSADGNVHCGIWEAGETYRPDGSFISEAYAGCRPQEADYETEPSVRESGEVGCSGGRIAATAPAEPVCNNGQMFVGESPMEGPVGVLHPGQSLSFSGFTCTSPDEQSIECVRDSDGAGFTVGRASYRYF